MKRYAVVIGFTGYGSGSELVGLYATEKDAIEALHYEAESIMDYYDEEQHPEEWLNSSYTEYNFWDNDGESFGCIHEVDIDENGTYDRRRV